MQHVDLTRALPADEHRSRARLLRRTDRARSPALPELRRRDRLHRARCIECDACIDICPVQCLTITRNGDEDDLRTRSQAPAINLTQALYVSAPLPQTARIMAKDEDLCVHCGLCAERCPTAAWDMQKSRSLPHARRLMSLPDAGRPRQDSPNYAVAPA